METNVQKQENNTTTIVVNGIVISPAASETLKNLQDGNNTGLRLNVEIMSDAICFIVSKLGEFSEAEKNKALMLVNDLSLVRDDFKSLYKPNEQE